MLHKIAIVGRPNVGKSTLFNRLTGRRTALVHDMPGVTRDRREAVAEIYDLSFIAIDTAGYEDGDAKSMSGRMRAQTEQAVADASVVLFVVDARHGLTPVDQTFGEILRRSGKPVVLCANKAEGKKGEEGLLEAYALGLGEPVGISAEHGLGMGDLRDALFAHLPDLRAPDDEDEDAFENDVLNDEREVVSSPVTGQCDALTDLDLIEEDEDEDVEAYEPPRTIRVAVVGRPNAGKSTLINRLLGEDRLLTGPEAGLTRDAIEVELMWGDQPLILIDTAGMRRKAKIEDPVEKMAVGETLRSLKFADVVILLVDAGCPFEDQDMRIAELAEREGRALVIGVNKWDAMTERQGAMQIWRETLDRKLSQLKGVPIVALSAQTGEGLHKLGQAVHDIYKIWNKRVSTSKLNRWLMEITQVHQPPAASGRRIRLRYMTQTKGRPPTFVIFCSRPEELPGSYMKFLTNKLREVFDFDGVPLRLQLRKGDNPYAHKKP
jgi:GTPase